MNALPEDSLNLIRRYLDKIRFPDASTEIYKEECVLSFDDPESELGIFLNLSTFTSFGAEFIARDFEKTGNGLYLQIKWKRVPKINHQEIQSADQSDLQPTKLAIGVEGGFQVGGLDYEIEKTHSLFILPERISIPYPNPSIPQFVCGIIDAVLARTDASKEAQALQWEEKKQPSVFAKDLPQLHNGKKISPDPSSWKCEESGYTENLWLNLSTGYIGSGRRNWDGTGGTGAALRHFEETGRKYPLAVKLGTITPHGADVYSYAEDDNVEDPYLADHLSHWGIDMMKMHKTERTTAELSIEINLTFEFGAITESGEQLERVSGAGLVGLRNIGNSCYCNSIFQALFSTPAFEQRFLENSASVLSNPVNRPADDLITQFCKLSVGLLTGKYASKEEGIAPRMIKNVVGKRHPEFSTSEQQDVVAYFQHILMLLQRAEKANGFEDVTNQFRFVVESKLRCQQSNRVRFIQTEGNVLSLAIPLDLASNVAEVAAYEEKVNQLRSEGQPINQLKPVLPQLQFEDLISHSLKEEEIEFLSPVTKVPGLALKTTRFTTFPNYLFVQLCKYVLGENWTQKKLEVSVEMPEQIDLEILRGYGLQPGEELLPEAQQQRQPEQQDFVADPEIVSSIMAMDFSQNAAKRAAKAVNNAGVEEAVNWVMEHIEDPNINDPLEENPSPKKDSFIADEEHLSTLLSLGISHSHAMRGLQSTHNDMERAVDWCFNNPEDEAVEMEDGNKERVEEKAAPGANLPTGEGRYRLKAIISHIGRSPFSGHYVVHIKKNGQWYIFNDNHVCKSSKPPFDLGYFYLYERI